MAGHIADAVDEVLGRLAAAGVSATPDPRDLNLPAVWVTVDGVSTRLLAAGVALVDLTLVAIVPDTGIPGTLDDLDDLVVAVEAAFPALEWETRAVALPSMGKTPLPALSTTIQLRSSTP